MKWGKAGRPSNKHEEKPEKPEQLEQEWTKDELSIISATEKSSLIMLGIAVVRQWIRDGKPKSDFAGVRPWIQIIKDSLSEKDKKHILPKLPENNKSQEVKYGQ